MCVAFAFVKIFADNNSIADEAFVADTVVAAVIVLTCGVFVAVKGVEGALVDVRAHETVAIVPVVAFAFERTVIVGAAGVGITFVVVTNTVITFVKVDAYIAVADKTGDAVTYKTR